MDFFLFYWFYEEGDVVCVVKNLWDFGILELERVLEFILFEIFVLLMSKTSLREVERLIRFFNVLVMKVVGFLIVRFCIILCFGRRCFGFL